MCYVAAELEKRMKSVKTGLVKYNRTYDEKLDILKECFKFIATDEGNNEYSFLRLFIYIYSFIKAGTGDLNT